MKATLTKNIKLKTATLYLKLEKEQERKDIVTFLNGKEFDDDTINQKVKEYLRKIHLLDRDGTLTKAGERVLKTKKVFEQEEGKYKIWYVEDDSLLGSKILYFERKSPINTRNQKNRNERIEKINLNFEKDNYFLPTKDKEEFSILNLVNPNTLQGEVHHNSENIQLLWKWDNLKKSDFKFNGKINKNSIKEHKISSSENLEQFILTVFPDWDENYKKLKIGFNNLTNDNEKQKFKLDYQVNNKAGFNNIHFSNIPIIPYNKEDAMQWRNWFVNQELKDHYFEKYDFEKLIKDTNDKEGFSTYKDKLNTSSVANYRGEIYNKDRQKQTPAFWHLAAPNDLNPDADKKYIINKFEYEVGKQISFNEIVNALIENSPNKINAVFYYDKYTNDTRQQKAMQSFFNAFNTIDDNKKHLITIKNLNGQKPRSSYLKQNTDINIIDINRILERRNLPHDRYIILAENQKNYIVWQLSNSIDYITFNNNEFDNETIGKIKNSVLFGQVKKEMLKQELRTFIENKL